MDFPRCESAYLSFFLASPWDPLPPWMIATKSSASANTANSSREATHVSSSCAAGLTHMWAPPVTEQVSPQASVLPSRCADAAQSRYMATLGLGFCSSWHEVSWERLRVLDSWWTSQQAAPGHGSWDHRVPTSSLGSGQQAMLNAGICWPHGTPVISLNTDAENNCALCHTEEQTIQPARGQGCHIMGTLSDLPSCISSFSSSWFDYSCHDNKTTLSWVLQVILGELPNDKLLKPLNFCHLARNWGDREALSLQLASDSHLHSIRVHPSTRIS